MESSTRQDDHTTGALADDGPLGGNDEIRRLVRTVSDELIEQGAKATVLTGSHARGEASPHSDIDIFAIGEGPTEFLELREGRLVGTYWFTSEEIRQRMYEPGRALVAVFGWRQAVVIADPSGIAAELKRDAEEWSWERVDRQADAWVCDELAGWIEYVQKLATSLERGRDLDACALRANTALRMAQVLAVHKRITSESENGLWETIADAGGPEWRAALEQALAKNGEDVRTSSTAAL
ncbi:MAG: nucleotidyltransferase domain-containing protein, partial [Actinomycetota bacterium]|nr:nucleotidyltransferase domain-containing protein [Actinomycetota bacterium]